MPRRRALFFTNSLSGTFNPNLFRLLKILDFWFTSQLIYHCKCASSEANQSVDRWLHWLVACDQKSETRTSHLYHLLTFCINTYIHTYARQTNKVHLHQADCITHWLSTFGKGRQKNNHTTFLRKPQTTTKTKVTESAPVERAEASETATTLFWRPSTWLGNLSSCERKCLPQMRMKTTT